MPMQMIDLNVQARSTTGKGHNRRARAEGNVPAIVYGADIKPTSVSITATELKKLEKVIGHNVFITLKGEGVVAGKTVMVRDFQVHPLKHNLIHTDFVTVDLNKPVVVEVEVETVGKPIGLAKQGVLTVVNREITVRCLPKDIPTKITVDVSHLDLHMSVHVADVKLPEGVKAVYTDNYTIASLTATREEKAPEVVAPVAEAGAAAAPGAAAPGAAGAAAPAAGAAGAKPGAAPAAGAAAPAAGGKAPAGGAKK